MPHAILLHSHMSSSFGSSVVVLKTQLTVAQLFNSNDCKTFVEFAFFHSYVEWLSCLQMFHLRVIGLSSEVSSSLSDEKGSLS